MKNLKLTAPEPTEAEVQRLLIKRLVAAGWLVVRVNGAGFRDSRGQFVRSYVVAGLNASSGFPDVLAMRDGTVKLFEVKRGGGILSDAQARFHDFAARHGIDVEVVEGLAGLQEATAKYFAV
jgi:hypothetical protein